MAALMEWDLLRDAVGKLGLTRGLWLCRGAVRCELLGELQPWDDFDVIVEDSEVALNSAFDGSGVESSRTFHDGHSFRLPNGRKVDIWSMTSTHRKRHTSLAEALSAFEFNVDAIAQCLRSGEIVDPLRVRKDILRRDLRIQSVATTDNNAYAPWKAAYLVLRHDLRPNASVIQLWAQHPSIAGLSPKAIQALRDELKALNIHQQIDHVEQITRKYPGLSQYAQALIENV